MHVSGLGSNPRVCEMYSRLESLEAEVTFAKYLDLLLRLVFIISSRWSTGKCFWFITNSLTHKTETKFPHGREWQLEQEEVAVETWRNRLLTARTPDSLHWVLLLKFGELYYSSIQKETKQFENSHTSKPTFFARRKRRGSWESLQRWRWLQSWARNWMDGDIFIRVRNQRAASLSHRLKEGNTAAWNTLKKLSPKFSRSRGEPQGEQSNQYVWRVFLILRFL